MMRCRIAFHKIISLVESAFFLADEKLALAGSVTNPTETRVDDFGALLFDTDVIGNTSCCAVVGLDWRRWLWMPEFFKTGTKGAGFFAIVEEGCKFGFGSIGQHFF